MRMRDRNPEISLMPEFDSEEAFNSNFAKETAAVAPYRDSQGRLVLDDIHDLPKVVEKVFAGHPEFTHTFSTKGLPIRGVRGSKAKIDRFLAENYKDYDHETIPLKLISHIRNNRDRKGTIWTNPFFEEV